MQAVKIQRVEMTNSKKKNREATVHHHGFVCSKEARVGVGHLVIEKKKKRTWLLYKSIGRYEGDSEYFWGVVHVWIFVGQVALGVDRILCNDE